MTQRRRLLSLCPLLSTRKTTGPAIAAATSAATAATASGLSISGRKENQSGIASMVANLKSIPGFVNFTTQELYDKYYNERLKAFESKGFLRDPLSGIYQVYLDGKMKDYNTGRDFVAELAYVCVKKFNETKGKTLELVNVARATESGGAKWKMYITFMAREYQNGPLVEYQAKVIKFLGDVEPPFPILCRPSPKPEI